VSNNAANTTAGQTVIALTGISMGYSGTTPQSITFSPLPNVTYGVAPITLSAVATSGLTVYFNSVTGPATLTGNVLKITGVGTVSVTAYQFGSSTYAEAIPITQSFMVAPATLTFTANDASRALSVPNPPFTYSASGFVYGDTQLIISGAPVFSTTAMISSPAGLYPINIGPGTLVTPNYTQAFVAGILDVSGVFQSITFNALPNVTYGATAIALNATSSSMLPVTYSVTGPAKLNGTSLLVTGVGMVQVTAMQAGNVTYHVAASVSQSFQVLPAVLTVTANNLTRPINTHNPGFTATFTGFVNGDTTSVVTGTPAFSTNATQASPTGTYPIAISRGTLKASNYTFTFVGGQLNVIPDFSIASNLSSLTLEPGVTGNLVITISSPSDFKGTITFSCGTLPASVTCTFSPTSVTADGTGTPITVALAMDNERTAALHMPRSGGQIMLANLFWLPGLLLGSLLIRARKRLRGSWLPYRLGAVVLFFLCVAGMSNIVGCGSRQEYTAPVVTTVTVTATSAIGGLSHTITLDLTVL
jgi:hypothetical protein